MVASFAMMFALMTSYTRARAESLISKCKVGFMERPERIVLFMIGAFTNRMAGVLWVILVLSVFTVADRIILTYRELREPREAVGMKRAATLPGRVLWNAFFWTYERATWQYDLMVIAILAFVWLTPPDWLGDPDRARIGPDRLAARSLMLTVDEYRPTPDCQDSRLEDRGTWDVGRGTTGSRHRPARRASRGRASFR